MALKTDLTATSKLFKNQLMKIYCIDNLVEK